MWNDVLASMAETWAATCSWKHGQPSVPDPPASVLGQNLYMTTGTMNLTHGIQLWFDEKEDYNYNTLGCTQGKMCGHYTQVQQLTVYIFLFFFFLFIYLLVSYTLMRSITDSFSESPTSKRRQSELG